MNAIVNNNAAGLLGRAEALARPAWAAETRAAGMEIESGWEEK